MKEKLTQINNNKTKINPISEVSPQGERLLVDKPSLLLQLILLLKIITMALWEIHIDVEDEVFF